MKIINRIKMQLGATALVVCASAGWSMSSSAALIDSGSELAFIGTYQPTGGTTLADSTGMTFPSPVIIAAGANDFAFATGGNANLINFNFSTLVPGDILTFAGGGTFFSRSVVIDYQTATALNMTIRGGWSLDGFDSTAGQLNLTADALGGLYTFSAAGTVFDSAISPDVTIVPVPAALWLFGSALTGLGLIKRRRKIG